MKKYFLLPIMLFSVLGFTLCCGCSKYFDNKEEEKKCQTSCPEGEEQKEDCSCAAPERLNATNHQQEDLLQAILENKEGKLYNLVNRIAPDSPIDLQNLSQLQEFKNLYAKNAEIFRRLNNQTNNLTLLSLLAPLENFDSSFRLLLKNGANPNYQAFTNVYPLQLAIIADQGNKVQMLLEAGAKVSFQGEINVLTSALNLKKYKALKTLADYAKKSGIELDFPSTYFTEAMYNKQAELAIAVLPITNAEIVNTPDNFGNLPLVQAAFMGSSNLIDALLENGANIELKDTNSRTPLLSYLNEVYIGQIEGNFPKKMDENVKNMVKHFLDKGADITAQDANGEDIMFYAVRSNNLPLINLLFDTYKYNINTRNTQGETPLFIAAQNNATLVPLMLQKGANPKVMDNNGRTPAIAAAEMGDMDMYEMLENAPAPMLEI